MSRRHGALFLVLVAAAGPWAAGCAADEAPAGLCAALPGTCLDGPAPTEPVLGAPTTVVPSTALPDAVTAQDANNNLDVVWHDGRVFLAFRSAPNHFASADAVLWVISSTDQASWQLEARFAHGTDVREPRLLSWQGRLWLYYAVLGRNPLAFEPKATRRSERLAPGEWSASEIFDDEGFIPWRTGVKGGVATMIGYTGGASIYDEGGEEVVEVRWLRSADGEAWEPAAGDDGVVYRGGVSETDLVVTPGGAVIAVGRNERGDDLGFGSVICRGEAAAPGDWRCRPDPRKFDSPLLFRHRDQIWLVGRRHLSETGHYDLGGEGSRQERSLRNQLDYWGKPKRCSLWAIDPVALTATWALDLPSKGDTCFASAIPLDDEQMLLYNYTSPLDDDDDPAWNVGQMGPTEIYRITLRLP